MDIGHFKRYVMHTLPTPGDVFCNNAVLIQSLHQLDLGFAASEKGGIHLFAVHLLGLITGSIEKAFEQRDGDSKVFYSDADVFDFLHGGFFGKNKASRNNGGIVAPAGGVAALPWIRKIPAIG